MGSTHTSYICIISLLSETNATQQKFEKGPTLPMESGGDEEITNATDDTCTEPLCRYEGLISR